MAKIHTYTTDGTVSIADKIIGTDGDVGANNATKNFTVGSLQTFMAGHFAPKLAFETLQTTVSGLPTNTTAHLKADGDILGPAGSITSTVVNIGTRSLSTGSFGSLQQSHAKLHKSGGLQLCGNSQNFSSGALAFITAGHIGSSPSSSDLGRFFGSIPGDGSGVLLIQNETGARSSVIMLKSTAATSVNTVFVVGSGNNAMPTTATGYAENHTPLLRLTGKADLHLKTGTNLNSNIHAKKFISAADSTYYVEPASETKVNEFKANKIKPITTAHLTNASSVFCIPKASATQTNSFSSGNNQSGELGQMLFDDNYIYICTSVVLGGATTWKRVAISAW